MSKIDWMYNRKSCTSCLRARTFLEKHEVVVADTTDANKTRKGRADAIALAKTVSRLVVAKGKKIVDVDLKKQTPSDDEIVALLLGPTGNLRAPTIRKGKTLYVGFSEETFHFLDLANKASVQCFVEITGLPHICAELLRFSAIRIVTG